MSEGGNNKGKTIVAVAVGLVGALGAGYLIYKKTSGAGGHPHGAGGPAHGHSHSRGNGIRPVVAVNQRGFTPEELRKYNGIDNEKVYVSLKRRVYEVAPHFYGPGHDYHVFAGQEASRALAKSDLTGKELNKYWVDCTEEELEQLETYVDTFESKYPVVGWYIPDASFFPKESA